MLPARKRGAKKVHVQDDDTDDGRCFTQAALSSAAIGPVVTAGCAAGCRAALRCGGAAIGSADFGGRA